MRTGTGKTIDAYVRDGVNKTGYAAYENGGFTYYTTEPSAYTKSEDGIALIDGYAYVVSNAAGRDLSNEAARAQKTVDIVRGTEISATDGNANAYEMFTNTNDITVTAPKDMTVVAVIDKTVSGRQKENDNEYYAFGANRTSGEADSKTLRVNYAYKNGTTTAYRALDVPQVASGATVTLSVDPRVSMTRGTGVGYYTYEDERVVFGNTDDITKDFVSAVSGKTASVKDSAVYTF